MTEKEAIEFLKGFHLAIRGLMLVGFTHQLAYEKLMSIPAIVDRMKQVEKRLTL